MIGNYLKLTLRNLIKYKTHSVIMVSGFAVGIAACCLISLFIKNELSFDKDVPDNDLIYRFYTVYNENGEESKAISFPSPFADALKDEFAEVESTGRYLPFQVFGAGDLHFRRTDRNERHYEKGFVWADQGFIDTLGIEIVDGDPQNVLADPGCIVISQKMADKYFPDENPIGKSLIVNNNEQSPFIVRGVMKGFSHNSHLNFQFLMSYAGAPFGERERTWWMQSNHTTYAKFRHPVNVRVFEKKLKGIVSKYYVPAAMESKVSWANDIENMLTIKMQPLKDVYLKSDDIRTHTLLPMGDIKLVWLFGIVAVMILLIACVNFVNLSTARSTKRAKEVGLRKVVGSTRRSLISQFLGESMLICFMSLLLGLALCELFLPVFKNIVGKSLEIPWTSWEFYLIILLSIIIIGLFAGAGPAFYLSSFSPITVLKGKVTLDGKSGGLRSFLVIFQFAVCIALIIGTVFVYRQLEYILNRPIGFEKDQLLIVEGTDALGTQTDSFKERILGQAGVLNASFSSYIPVESGNRSGHSWCREGRQQMDSLVTGQRWLVDENYIDTMGMEIIEGRGFSDEMQDNHEVAIINESMVKQLGLSDPVGARITNRFKNFTVIGVIKDFQYDSAKFGILPLCMRIGDSKNMLLIRVDGLRLGETIESIQRIWGEFSPHQDLRLNFVDESYARMYSGIRQMVSILGCFAILAIFIASLGLFALSAFMTEQRCNEISIRRVVGSSTEEIFKLLSVSFLKLVVLSFLIAAPLSWYGIQKWLNLYAYRINLTWDVFVLAGVLAVFIATGTISFHTIRAANRDPARGLRTE